MVENRTQAVGRLIADAVNQAMSALELYGACCPRCCGGCSALLWCRDNDPATADRAVRSIWDGTDLDRWDWQTTDGGIDWKVVSAAWELADLRGCHGVVENTLPATETSAEGRSQ